MSEWWREGAEERQPPKMAGESASAYLLRLMEWQGVPRAVIESLRPAGQPQSEREPGEDG